MARNNKSETTVVDLKSLELPQPEENVTVNASTTPEVAPVATPEVAEITPEASKEMTVDEAKNLVAEYEAFSTTREKDIAQARETVEGLAQVLKWSPEAVNEAINAALTAKGYSSDPEQDRINRFDAKQLQRARIIVARTDPEMALALWIDTFNSSPLGEQLKTAISEAESRFVEFVTSLSLSGNQVVTHSYGEGGITARISRTRGGSSSTVAATKRNETTFAGASNFIIPGTHTGTKSVVDTTVTIAATPVDWTVTLRRKSDGKTVTRKGIQGESTTALIKSILKSDFGLGSGANISVPTHLLPGIVYQVSQIQDSAERQKVYASIVDALTATKALAK